MDTYKRLREKNEGQVPENAAQLLQTGSISPSELYRKVHPPVFLTGKAAHRILLEDEVRTRFSLSCSCWSKCIYRSARNMCWKFYDFFVKLELLFPIFFAFLIVVSSLKSCFLLFYSGCSNCMRIQIIEWTDTWDSVSLRAIAKWMALLEILYLARPSYMLSFDINFSVSRLDDNLLICRRFFFVDFLTRT